jgi:flagellar protein FliO/FliZ
MLLPLFLVIILLYSVLYFVKKYGLRFSPQQFQFGGIRVVSTQQIMPKKYISLIKVEDKLLIVGVSDNSFSMLKEIDCPEELLDSNIPQPKSILPANLKDIIKKNLGMK